MASKEKLSLQQKWDEMDALNLRSAEYYLRPENIEKYGENSLMVQVARETMARLRPEGGNGR